MAKNFKRFESTSRFFEATDDTFKKLISGPKDKNVLVDFYAKYLFNFIINSIILFIISAFFGNYNINSFFINIKSIL